MLERIQNRIYIRKNTKQNVLEILQNRILEQIQNRIYKKYYKIEYIRNITKQNI